MKRSNLMLGCVVTAIPLALLACLDPNSLIENNKEGDGNENEAGQVAEEEPKGAEVWQDMVDSIKQLTRGQKIPNHLINPEQPATEEVFDPNLLLVPLNHLRLQPGYVLDFVYYYDGMGGLPILYARKESMVPYESFEAYHQALINSNTEADPLLDNYLRFIETDGSQEGFFQWVLLKMMGGKFYLFWHSGYVDAEIIASQSQLEYLVNRLDSTDKSRPLSSTQKRQALRIDPTPVVTIEDNQVNVRVVTFTRWGGFYEDIYTLTRSAPHQVLNQESNQLVEYDCGISF